MIWLSVTCSFIIKRVSSSTSFRLCSTHNSELLETLAQWEFEVNEVEITESVCGILCVKSKDHGITNRLWVSLPSYMSLEMSVNIPLGFPCVSDGKESACSVGDLGQEDPLEKSMAPHSSILVWRIPWTEEPGRLQSMESQRVRQDWMTNTATFFS